MTKTYPDNCLLPKVQNWLYFRNFVAKNVNFELPDSTVNFPILTNFGSECDHTFTYQNP